MTSGTDKSKAKSPSKPNASTQRNALLDSERKANRGRPRNFKDDALTDKVVRVEPDGTGPSSMDSMDPPKK